MIITEILSRNRRVYGEEIALIEREPAKNMRREITWREFDRQANAVANALIARGIKKGDKVVTSGGLYGEVAAVQENLVVLKLADNLKVRVAKSAISGLEGSPEPGAKR